MHPRVFALVLLCGAVAFAQSSAVPSFELEQLRLNPGARHGLRVDTADLLTAGTWRASLTLHYQHLPLVYRGEDGAVLATIVGSRLTTHLAGAWAPTKWLEVGAQVPVVLWQGNGSSLDAVGVTAPTATALGTPYLQARFGILRQAEAAPLDVSAGFLLGLPIGSASGLTRDPTVSFLPRVSAGRTFGQFVRAGLELGATVRGGQVLSPDNPDARDSLGSMFDLGVGAATLGDGLRGELSLRAAIPFTRAPAGAELLAGARYPLGPVELYALAGPGFGRLPGTPVFRVLLGVAFPNGRPKTAPPRCVEGTPYALAECPDADRDGDGVKNGVDACPEVKGAASAKGCPDRDGDGVKDEADECPAVKGLVELKGCPDLDGDGVKDEVDECPEVKGPAALKGCPDGDGDALTDATDACPAEAGPPERKGCPAKDRDGDTVLDENDSCPDAAGPVERAGCPLVDTDGDSVEDPLDNCPKEAGPADNQGCPKAKRQLVVITREKLVIKDKVYFDTAKSNIQPRSFGLLDQVARVLTEHPEVAKVTVEGHTDSRGPADFNRALSQSRSESVKAYLVKKGVAAERLDAKGYGPDRPVADNATPAGREQNRRVEFVISTAEKVETKTLEAP